MWVQLRAIKRIEVSGVLQHFRPGDWVEVGKQTALRWIAAEEAWIPTFDPADFVIPGKVGILCVGDGDGGPQADASATQLGAYSPTIGVTTGTLETPHPWSKTLLWDGRTPIRPELLVVGFGLLDTWQMAAPLVSYDLLAANIGSDEDRQRTLAVIHDLRVPVYNPGFVFVSDTQDTESLMRVWCEEQASGGHSYLAFLRAIYRAHPLILPLPASWVDRNAVRG